MRALIPLQQSHEHDAFEGQLKQLAMALYEVYLADAAQNINVYGTPYLGNRDLLQKNLVADGIGNFEAENVDSDVLKYLHMARRYRNGKRGLHLLNTYLRCLWRDDYKAYQLLFAKDGVYAQDASLFSPEDVSEMAINPDDFILTSRIRIELDPNLTPVNAIPSDIANSLDDTLPARLFIHDIVVRRDVNDGVNFGQYSDFLSVTTETVTKFEVETAVYLSSMPYPSDMDEKISTSASIQSISIKNALIENSMPIEAFGTVNSGVVSMQLRNILIEHAVKTEAFSTVNSGVISMQLRNILIANAVKTEAFSTANSGVISIQLRNVLLAMTATEENLTSSASIDSISITG